MPAPCLGTSASPELQGLRESIEQPVCFVDPQGRIAFGNRAFSLTFGDGVCETTGRNFVDLINPTSGPSCPLSDVCSTSSRQLPAHNFRRKDGTVFRAGCWSHPFKLADGASGNLIVFDGVSVDRDPVESGRTGSELLRQIGNNLDYMFYLLDRTATRFVNVSPACEVFTGRRQRGWEGHGSGAGSGAQRSRQENGRPNLVRDGSRARHHLLYPLASQRGRLRADHGEAMVLEGLRWSLHGMSGEWEMRFEKSAADALQAMASARFDAIITDMRMPAMDGAELLEVVKRRYPGMVRFVLSGQANKDAVLRSVAPAHQFLSKPCDPVELKSRLTQAFAMRDLLSNDLLQGTVSRLRNLPSLPALYGELTAELQSEDCSVFALWPTFGAVLD